MVTIDFWYMDKNKLSTFRPYEMGVRFCGVFKDDTSVTNPVVRINLKDYDNGDKFPAWNYCYIKEFNRYYWIDDYIADHGNWWVVCRVDVLASFYDDIINTTAYVLRSSNPPIYPVDPNQNEQTLGTGVGWVSDSVYPGLVMENIDVKNIDPPYVQNFGSGSVVVGVIAGTYDTNSSGSIVMDSPGAITYYLMDVGTFEFILWMLMSNIAVYTGIDSDVMDPQLLKCIFNPLQYFAVVNWFPFEFNRLISEIGESQLETRTDMKYGWWTIDISTLRPGSNVYRITGNGGYINRALNTRFNNNPNADATHYYLNYSPYSEVMLYAYPFGDIPIDRSKFYFDYIRLVTHIDLLSGEAYLDVETYKPGPDNTILSNAIIYRQHAKVGVEVPLAQMSVDTIETGATAVQTVSNAIGNLFTLNITGAISTVASGINDMIHSSAPQLLKNGVQGSMALYRGLSWAIISHFKIPVQEAPDIYGIPVYRTYRLGDYFGYVKIGFPSFRSASATSIEIDEVNRLLMDGCYIDENPVG